MQVLTAAGSRPSAAAEFTGNLASFGLYQQCVAVKKGSYDGAPFDAKYCQIGFPWKGEAQASAGECAPQSCSSTELTALIYRILAVVSPLPEDAYVHFFCEEEVGWDADAIVTVFLCCAFLLCVVMATAYDIFSLHKEQKSKEEGNVRIQLEGGEATPEETSALNDDTEVKEGNDGQNEVAIAEENNEEQPTEHRK
ncbi:uncharacterized protein LOC117116172 isoform X2 [Anneissia japonica]|uniref:uncharacterized protein LOC117116172 isoform X2 n=1 Tax=Anneissia japonica TaxID=1529436 RepID=UPI0014255E94|nr:uncharacterized protein LOC117116172 isoform X2 [Anneissia japonica]